MMDFPLLFSNSDLELEPYLSGELSTSSSPSQVTEEESQPVVKKRKESNRKCEQKRRNRFNEKLQLLQDLLFETERQRSNKKVRKEDVINEAISYITELRQKSQDNVLTLMANAPAKLLMDPLSTSISNVDLEAAFVPIFQQSYLTLTTCKPPFTFLRLNHYIKTQYNLLLDIATKTDRMDFMLYAELFAETGYYGLIFSPNDCLYHAERAFALYEKVKKSNLLPYVGARFQIRGFDLACLMYCDLATIYYMKGKFQGYSRMYNELKDSPDLQMSPGQTSSLLCTEFMRDFVNERPPSIPHALKIASKIGSFTDGYHAKFVVGFSFISHSNDAEELNYGIDLINESMEHLSTYDVSVSIASAACPVKAYYRAGRYEDALTKVDKAINEFEQWELDGFFGRSELFRLKAEALYAQGLATGNLADVSGEIELLLHKALQNTRDLDCPLVELKVLNSMNKMLQQGLFILTQKEDVIAQTSNILQSLEPSGDHVCTIVEEAESYVKL